jgi:hypothetical protein
VDNHDPFQRFEAAYFCWTFVRRIYKRQAIFVQWASIRVCTFPLSRKKHESKQLRAATLFNVGSFVFVHLPDVGFFPEKNQLASHM